jgi:hypothetical protein
MFGVRVLRLYTKNMEPFTLLYITLPLSPPTGVYGSCKRTATKTLESSFTPRETQGMASRLPSNGTTTLVLPVVVISSYLWPKLLISMWLMSRGVEKKARIRQPMTISSKLRSAFPHQVEACDRPLVRFVVHRIVRSCPLTCTVFHNNRDQDRESIFKTVRHGSELWWLHSYRMGSWPKELFRWSTMLPKTEGG